MSSTARYQIVRTLACMATALLGNSQAADALNLEKLFVGGSATEVAAIEVRGATVEVHLAAGAGEPGQESLITQRNQRLVTSADRAQLGRVTYQNDDKSNKATFELLRNRTPIWSVTVDGFSDFSISNDGSTVVETLRDNHMPQAGRLRVYGTGGEVLGSRPLTGIRKVEISRDGNRIAVDSSEGVVILDRKADFVRNLDPAFDFSLAEDGQAVALLRRGSVTVSSEVRSPFITMTEGLARDAAFSADGSSLAIVDPGFLYVVRADTGQLIFKTPVARPGAEFQDVDFSRDGTRIAFSEVEILEKATRTTPGRARADIGSIDLNILPSSPTVQPLGLPNWHGSPILIDIIDNRQILIDAGARIYRFTPSTM